MAKKERIVLQFDELEDRIVPTLLGKQLFPSDNPWNQKINNAPVAANSAAIISNIGTGVQLHPDFGQRYGNHSDLYGIPYNIVSGTQPKVSVVIDNYRGESDLLPVPIPANAVLEGDYQDGPKPETQRGDSHLIVWDKDNNIAYELYHASRPAENDDNKWHAAGESVWDMKANTFRTLGWTSADAAGLSVLAGLVRPDEGLPVSQGGQGVITHAIRFTITNSKVLGKYIYPASHEANSGTNTSTMPPMGTRFRLKASVDISNFSPQAKIIAQAMKDYGLILADNGSSMYFTGAAASVDANNNVTLTWDDNDIQSSTHGLKALHAGDFEVVDLTPKITSVSQTSAAPGATITVTGQNFSGSASSGGTNRLWVVFGNTAVAATYLSDTQVSAIVPSGTGTVPLKVRSGIISPESGNFKDPIFGYGDSGTVNFTFSTGVSFPTVQSIIRASSNPTNARNVAYNLTFSAAVTGVDVGDFALTTTGVSGATVASITGSGTTYTVTLNTGTGDGTLRLDLTDNDSIKDASNNPLGSTGAGNGSFTTGQVYDIDKTMPTVASVARGGGNPTGAASVAFTVTFSEIVSGVSAADFSLTTTGVSGATIGSISGSGTTYTVNVNTGSGSGTIRLDLIDDDTISDAVGNKLGGTGAGNGTFTAGEVYTINRASLNVTVDQAAEQADPTASAPILFTVVFSASVTNFVAADVTVGGTANPRKAVVSGSGTTYTVAVSGMKRTGTVTVSLAAGVASDAQGTLSSASTSTDNMVTYNRSPDRVGVFRNGKWWFDTDGERDFDDPFALLGTSGDKPVRGDFDGDGIEESGVYRGYGKWLIDLNHDGQLNDVQYAKYGTLGDTPVVGDWDGDGDDDLGVFRQGRWWWLDNGDRILNDVRLDFGKSGFQAVVGDWDGDGDDDLGVFNAGKWYRDSNGDRLLNDPYFAAYGKTGDKPVAGDWNGDGITEIGVFRNGLWFCDEGDYAIENDLAFTYGALGDTPLAAR